MDAVRALILSYTQAAEEGLEAGANASKAYPLMTNHRVPKTAITTIASSSLGFIPGVGQRTLPAIPVAACRQVKARKRFTLLEPKLRKAKV